MKALSKLIAAGIATGFLLPNATCIIASAQQGASPEVRIALQEGVCASVRAGNILTLDWNPGIHQDPGTFHVRHFGLFLHRVSGTGGSVITGRTGASRKFMLGTPTFIAGPNGFYHAEFHVGGGVPPGTYRLTGSVLDVDQNVDGTRASMTAPPELGFYCLTVMPPASLVVAPQP